MHLTLFNGSPRQGKSNTALLLYHFAEGFCEQHANTFDCHYLMETDKAEEHLNAFRNSEHVIVGFPLYTDAMPGMVKNFFESLQPLIGRDNNPTLGFIVQSGFTEPFHSRAVEKYLEKLACRLGCTYSGTIIKGGAEGIRLYPKFMTNKLFFTFHELGWGYSYSAEFNERLVRKLTPWERFSPLRLLVMKILFKAGLSNFYWNDRLKKNQAFHKRFDQPYKV